jgi:hypothetical protein
MQELLQQAQQPQPQPQPPQPVEEKVRIIMEPKLSYEDFLQYDLAQMALEVQNSGAVPGTRPVVDPSQWTPTTTPMFAPVHNPIKLRAMEEQIMQKMPNTDFDQRSIQGRKDFLGRVDGQIRDVFARATKQAKAWNRYKAECQTLIEFDQKLTWIRQEIQVAERHLHPKKRARSRPKRGGDGDESDGDGDHAQKKPMVIENPMAEVNLA